jgi:hypothetical protein
MRPSGFARAGRLAALLLAAVVCAPAQAQPPPGTQFQYEWYAAGQPVAGTFTATPGSSFTLQVFLRQTAGPTDVLADEHGLFGGGVRATYGNPTGTPGVIRVASTAGISYNSGFTDTESSDSSLVATPDYAQFTALTDGLTGVTGSGQQVLLGAFTFQVQGGVGSSTVLTAVTVPTVSDTVTFDNSYELDPLISPQSLTVSVVPVPEPGLVLAFGAAAAAGLALRRRVAPSKSRAGGPLP